LATTVATRDWILGEDPRDPADRLPMLPIKPCVVAQALLRDPGETRYSRRVVPLGISPGSLTVTEPLMVVQKTPHEA
jgi:hypothetical protein